MEFCPVCEMLLQLQVTAEEELVLQCAHCTYQRPQLESTLVSVEESDPMAQQLGRFVNPTTKYDPTLPRIRDLPCPNPQCEAHRHPSDMLVLRVDEKRLRFLYVCCVCDAAFQPRTDGAS